MTSLLVYIEYLLKFQLSLSIVILLKIHHTKTLTNNMSQVLLTKLIPLSDKLNNLSKLPKIAFPINLLIIHLAQLNLVQLILIYLKYIHHQTQLLLEPTITSLVSQDIKSRLNYPLRRP